MRTNNQIKKNNQENQVKVRRNPTPIVINTGISAPKYGMPVLWKYPFAYMMVGDSFVVPDGKEKHIAGCARSWCKRHKSNASFVLRWMPEEMVYRVFRIK